MNTCKNDNVQFQQIAVLRPSHSANTPSVGRPVTNTSSCSSSVRLRAHPLEARPQRVEVLQQDGRLYENDACGFLHRLLSRYAHWSSERVRLVTTPDLELDLALLTLLLDRADFLQRAPLLNRDLGRALSHLERLELLLLLIGLARRGVLPVPDAARATILRAGLDAL